MIIKGECLNTYTNENPGKKSSKETKKKQAKRWMKHCCNKVRNSAEMGWVAREAILVVDSSTSNGTKIVDKIGTIKRKEKP